ncbi:MAG: tRNA (adenosine(37)-N6)-threonylcarbamoyltransferase complex ATPase subunit type 1 TsaE [Bacillota bacterium]|nr:tRNA (adenosine(37)-N6)-threonylcarbamoyltransferase complex ATPase subunit type 1 TsaE [Bacillota bacterium]
MELSYKTDNEIATFELGQKLGQALVAGDFVALSGDLGAGKTAFAKGIAKGLEVEEPVTSPTFTIVQQYEGRLSLFHFDTYRLEECWDLEDIGYEDYFFGEGVCLVEWPEKVWPLLPGDFLHVTIEKCLAESPDCRLLRLVAKGDRYVKLLEELN